MNKTRQSTSMDMLAYQTQQSMSVQVELKQLGIKQDQSDNELEIQDGKVKGIDPTLIKTNHCYLIFFSMTFLFGSTLQGGWALVECGQVGLVLDKKLGWNIFSSDNDSNKNQNFLNNLTIITVIAGLGLTLGGNIGGTLMPRFGSRKLIIGSNIIALIFNVLKLTESTAGIMIARFMFGLSMGVAAVSLSKAINDTVPSQNQQVYGALVNAGFNLGIFLSNFFGMLVPLDNGGDGDVQKMMDDQNWRIVFGFPIVFEVLTIVVLLFVIRHDSIIQLLQEEEPTSELLHSQLKKVYQIPSTITYTQLATKLKGEIKMKEPMPCTVVQGFTKKQYRRSSFTAIMIALIHQLTGASSLVFYQTQIFLNLNKEGNFPIPVMWAVQLNNFTGLLFCFSFPLLSKLFRQESAMFASHVGLVISLFCVAIFSYIELNGLLILFMVLFLIFFQFGIGTIGFIHIFETNVDSIVGFANQILFFAVFLTSLITPTLIKHLSVHGTFTLYGAISLAGLIYMLCFVKQTSYFQESAEGGKKVIIKKTEKDKKELYWPDEFKIQTQAKE